MKVKETCIIACFVSALLGMRQTLEAKWGLEDVIEKGQILKERDISLAAGIWTKIGKNGSIA